MKAPRPAAPPLRPRRFLTSLALLSALSHELPARTDPAATTAQRLDQSKADPVVLNQARALADRAQALVFAKETPLITRAQDAAGLALPRHLKPAAEPADAEALALALARDDIHLARQLAEELPELAAAYRLSGLGVLKLRVLQQLGEIASWQPLARPESSAPDAPRTGQAHWLTLRALRDTLEVFPAADLPPDLATKLDLAFLDAAKPLFSDLRDKRLPFLKDPAPVPGAEPDAPPPLRREAAASSEWIQFHEAVLGLATRLGTEVCREEYDLALANLRVTLRQGDVNGAWRGGLPKAMEDHLNLARCARILAGRGETWLARSDFFPKHLGWISGHLMPGRSLMNTGGTAGLHPVDTRQEDFRRFYSREAVLLGQPQAWFFLQKWFAAPSADRFGIIALSDLSTASAEAPPLWSYSSFVPTLKWRDSWDDFGSALWTTVGYPGDPDTHLDRGHVSYFRRGRPILIEAGTPPPGGDAGLADYFASQAAHNVLQIGSKALTAATCTIRPGKINEAGGSAILNLTPSTNGLATSWSRKLDWDHDKLVITDQVTLAPGVREILRLRFHLGDAGPVAFTKPDPLTHAADSPVGRFEFKSVGPLVLEQSAQTNFTLFTDPTKPEPASHTCIEVRTASPVTSWRLETRVLSR